MVLALGACGDNLVGDGAALVPARTMFIVAHFDDDMIFMEPELAHALASGSSTTVYVSSGDPLGPAHQHHTAAAARLAYEHATGDRRWDCGPLEITGLPVWHCRLPDAGVSMIGLDVAEGGRNGERPNSLLHLVERAVPSLPILGPSGGAVTSDTLIAELAEVIAQTKPDNIHVLDFTGTHGDDHSGHTMTAAFALWAAASAGYAGHIISHRGYNVANEPANLSEADYALAKPILGYFDACYMKCGRCGTECAVLDSSHEQWLRRQYSARIDRLTDDGRLESSEAPGSFLAALGDGSIGLADATAAGLARLGPDGHLAAGTRCITSAEGNDDPLVLAPCSDDPAQLWMLDSEGLVWNGRPPGAALEMAFDHMRCLAAEPTGAPVCGSRWQPHWRVVR